MIHQYLSERAERNPEKVAVIQGDRRICYEELSGGVQRLGSFLSEHLLALGDRAVLMLDNSPEYIVAYLGVQSAAAVAVPLNAQSSLHELKKVVEDCLPRVLITTRRAFSKTAAICENPTPLVAVLITDVLSSDEHEQFESTAAVKDCPLPVYTLVNILRHESRKNDLPVVRLEDLASIIYTSGTTGVPKGVMLTHANFDENAKSIIAYLRMSERDRTMVVLPFNYAYGTSLLTTAIMTGASMVLENSFLYPNAVLDKMITERVTGLAGVPSTFALLLNMSNIRKYRFSDLRYITQAGGAMSPSHVKELSEVLPGTDIYIMYGQTEATARLSFLEPEKMPVMPGSIGRAIPGVMIELIREDGNPAAVGEEGEIVATGENIMKGYWNNPDETAKVLKEGRLYTGDIAVEDGEGYLTIISRRSDFIKSGAHKISPREVEEVIQEINEVHEAAVVGVNDRVMGAVIKAFIVLKSEHKIGAMDLQRHCRQKLAPFKVPKEIVFVKQLPRTGSGKVKKHLLDKAEIHCER